MKLLGILWFTAFSESNNKHLQICSTGFASGAMECEMAWECELDWLVFSKVQTHFILLYNFPGLYISGLALQFMKERGLRLKTTNSSQKVW